MSFRARQHVFQRRLGLLAAEVMIHEERECPEIVGKMLQEPACDGCGLLGLAPIAMGLQQRSIGVDVVRRQPQALLEASNRPLLDFRVLFFDRASATAEGRGAGFRRIDDLVAEVFPDQGLGQFSFLGREAGQGFEVLEIGPPVLLHDLECSLRSSPRPAPGSGSSLGRWRAARRPG